MFIPFFFPKIPNVCCYFQMRMDTQSISDNISFECGLDEEKTLHARQRLFREIQIQQYCELLQVHGTRTVYSPVVYESDRKPEKLQEGDGIATDRENLALLIKTADCQPILVADLSGKYIMALHVGWRGHVQRYIQKAFSEFCSVYSVLPENICVVRGPSLSPTASEFIAANTEFPEQDMRYYTPETKTMNLWEMTKVQLQEIGILAEHIYSLDLCTFSSPSFFSYRREQHTGRQANIIIMRNS